MSAADSLSIDDLARLCASETDKFNRRLPSDTRFCFELFRRALAGGVSEAFTQLYRIYDRQMQAWVQRHPQFVYSDESAEYFASAAWARFFFALRGAKFAEFRSLPAVLSYLKQCVHTAIALYLRDQQRARLAPLDAGQLADLPDLPARVVNEQIARRIVALLPDERDRVLAHARFAEQLMPREIVRAYPGWWKDERAVSVDIYRIRRILRADAELRSLLDLPEAEP
ncbi:MAG TPA: hypothetical protein PLO33_04585 [Kouleothrix sp.]|uniref:hypothetical protein n=1 Tax=Kouleothrix sp. TaxID=2779161 RepID=UPI002B58DB79|nr:hypothetical protein [Kouleothrix sp.]HRC74931.1 hypothetical protein [Kouleothrix sp.]